MLVHLPQAIYTVLFHIYIAVDVYKETIPVFIALINKFLQIFNSVKMRILFCIEFMVMCVLQISSSKRNIDTLTPRNPPGFKSPKKLWWAKEILPNYHISGRLTERQIKYAKDAGFKSIVSLFEYQFHEKGENEIEIEKFGDDVLLNDIEYRSIIPSLTEMDFYTVLQDDDDWATVEAIDKLTTALDRMPTPVLLFCDRGYTVTLSVLLHFAKKSKNNPKFRPLVNSEKIYKMSAAMGLDFTDDDLKQLISDVTGEPLVENPPQPDVILTEWMDYWPVHPVYKNYFTAGQINEGHLPVIEETGFQHVVNMRLGKTHNGKPSQEIVTLINVNDKTPTYAGEGHAARQDEESLKAARLDTKIGQTFMPENIDKGLDYERSNPGEFGDKIGYNEELERKAFEKSELKYYHMPIGKKF